MTGHERILAMRSNGIKPTVVWVNDMAGYRVDPEDETVTVAVHGDTPEACDFRFLEGIERVIFESANQARVHRFIHVLRGHCKRVVATTWQDENTPVIERITDTQGVMNWPT